MSMRRLIVLIYSLLLVSGPLLAAEETLILNDGNSVKVLFFEPADSNEAPPLALLVAGGSSNEFMARAQFWMGKEMVGRGWAIAVPISTEGRMYFVDNPRLFPEIIGLLRDSHDLQQGKTLLVGISSGGSAALAIAAQDPRHYLGVVATPGRVWDDSIFENLNGLPIYLRIGEKDNFRWNRRLQGAVELLHRAGANVDAAIMPEAKHIFRLDWENLEDWLQDLQQPGH